MALSIILSLFSLTGCEAPGPDKTFEVAVQGVLSAGIAGDASYTVIGSIQHGGSLWDVNRSERLYNWNRKAGEYTSFRAADISASGRVAITAEDTNLLVWDVSSGRSLNFWRAPSKVISVAIGPDGRYALLGMQNNQAAYFDIERGTVLYEFQHEAEVHGVSLSENGLLALTGSDDQTARLWRVEDGAPLHTFTHANQVRTVALAVDGSMAFTSAQREDAVVWDTTSGDALTKLDYRYENFTSARFSPDNKQLVLGTFRGDIYLVSTSDGTELAHWKAKSRSQWGPGSSGAILAVAFTGDKKIVAVSSDGLLQTFSR
ncbi:WD40 repeat domain-containing protein [Hahella sp. CCB-MM4]|uniref:WD40 repeat domain-containing protein n=1 Tax=Hahella sp. (strain CCB-MM4) TaxID=1926491 RepID=UPI001FEE70FB|nr:PQQ-binding-like beta-propeller repeat protein [Hahella sp. CCB-MM4]